jgi:hypothetical protein
MNSFEVCVVSSALLSALTSAFKCINQYDSKQNKCGRKNAMLSSLKDVCFYFSLLFLAVKITKTTVL